MAVQVNNASRFSSLNSMMTANGSAGGTALAVSDVVGSGAGAIPPQ
jgi:hypothetical protein